MLSWRTNEEKLLCLKYFGRIFSENSLTFLTIKAVPSLFHEIISECTGFWKVRNADKNLNSTSRISYVLTKKAGTFDLGLK